MPSKSIVVVFASGFFAVACNNKDKSADAVIPTVDSAKIKDSLAKLAAVANPEPPPVDSANMTTVQWLDKSDKDFGKITEGQTLEVSFRFKNTGTKPLVISRVTAQCGCTVPETPQKPYAPGETGEIKASFNSTGKTGANTKEVYMLANTNPATSVLTFHVQVNPKKG
jgi:hypothetical protein